MNLKSELDKYKNFIDEFGINNVFCALSMSLYMDEPLTREFSSNYITDDHNDKKVDFLAIMHNEDNLKRIYLVQSTFSEKENKDSAKANKASDLNTAISWLFSGNKDLIPNKLKSFFSEFSKMEKIVLKDLRKMLKLRQYLPKYSRIIKQKSQI